MSEDGAIWVTIDDNEAHYLKVLMDEVFGRGNFVANAIWQKVYSERMTSTHSVTEETDAGPNQGDYIRPIVLLQAQNSNEPVNVDVLRAHLVDDLHIPADQVKVATGTQRELEGLDLASRDCPVRYIITVRALREGWDCPFAYILCSVQNIRSATAVEQLLGRVLRMPYARRRSRPALNKAHAHVTEAETGLAANALADRLIDGMGFGPLDMASMIAPQLPLGWQDDWQAGTLFAAPPEPPLPKLVIDLPASKPLPDAVADAVAAGQAQLSSGGDRQRLQWQGGVRDAVQAGPRPGFGAADRRCVGLNRQSLQCAASRHELDRAVRGVAALGLHHEVQRVAHQAAAVAVADGQA